MKQKFMAIPNNFNTQGHPKNFELERFVKAQQNIYPTVIKELKNASKQTHWMWFIFPQYKNLGASSTAQLYAIKSVDEAKAYFDHPILGLRLLECCKILLGLELATADEIFGFPDNKKLQSCMTLFSITIASENIFNEVLAKYYKNEKDIRTIELLGFKN